jgi:hypothetical protein
LALLGSNSNAKQVLSGAQKESPARGRAFLVVWDFQRGRNRQTPLILIECPQAS